MTERVTFVVGDLVFEQTHNQLGLFDHVMSNPPFFERGSGQLPKNKARALATIESTADLSLWIDFMIGALRDNGTITLIHRAEREDEIIDLLRPRCGNVGIMDLPSKQDDGMQKLIIIQAIKGADGTGVTRKELILHNANDGFTEEALAILRDAQHAPISSSQKTG